MIEPTPDDQSPSDPGGDVSLIAEEMRVLQDHGRTLLQIARVEWTQPHDPIVRWITWRTWVKPPSVARLAAAQARALQTPRFFRVCRVCSQRQNAGQMYDIDLCQSCASAEIGVVY